MRGPAFDYEDVVAFLASRGIDDADLRFGSILEGHLDFIRATMSRQLRPRRRPLIGLHIGNFVGVSLAAFADSLRSIDARSTVVAIDPNVTVAGIDNPQEHVIAALERYNLLDCVLLLTGYSFEPTELSGAPPVDRFPASGVETLPQLARLGVKFDTALIDGNHRGTTVQRELEWLRPRMRRRGIVFLDDVTDAWPEIRDVFGSARSYRRIGHDGRIGALRPS